MFQGWEARQSEIDELKEFVDNLKEDILVRDDIFKHQELINNGYIQELKSRISELESDNEELRHILRNQ